ncbi:MULTISPECIES: hypothetical protein [unclassified Fibrobacter]|uniref:hypothetical protein n=1 Tax=unclassified Fibrobacter TaxID=2634177 RepID=UPI00091885B4|nr:MULTISPECIES: hypothetical protein [unclassified Fibrobacter]MCQ2100724.1 hypothetical protein [Fibrobacter sp.]OWV03855.1 hypothetical protein B7993_12500 [Fibrobacter sp. UWH3]SHL03690.1 hypothetical protein SAMN05720765_10849 [Fibrobacter sp. UWH6]
MNLSKFAFVVAAGAMFSLTACGDSSSNAQGAQCSVSRSGNSVTLSEYVMGISYTSTATVVSDSKVTFHSVYGYSTQADADVACADQKEEAASWRDGSYQVECSGLQITVDEYSEYLYGAAEGLDEVEENFNDICQSFNDFVSRGEM